MADYKQFTSDDERLPLPITADLSEAELIRGFLVARRNFCRALALGNAANNPSGRDILFKRVDTDAGGGGGGYVESVVSTRKATFYNTVLTVRAPQSSGGGGGGVSEPLKKALTETENEFARTGSQILIFSPADSGFDTEAKTLASMGYFSFHGAMMSLDFKTVDPRVYQTPSKSYLRHTLPPGRKPLASGGEDRSSLQVAEKKVDRDSPRFEIREVLYDQIDRKRQWGVVLMTGFSFPFCDLDWHGRVWSHASGLASSSNESQTNSDRSVVMRLLSVVDLHDPTHKIVSTAMVALGGGVATVFNVSTPKQYRGYGLGTALSAECLRVAAAAGYRHVVLQASGSGEPVYTKLKFRKMHIKHPTFVKIQYAFPGIGWVTDTYFSTFGLSRTTGIVFVLLLLFLILYVLYWLVRRLF